MAFLKKCITDGQTADSAPHYNNNQDNNLCTHVQTNTTSLPIRDLHIKEEVFLTRLKRL